MLFPCSCTYLVCEVAADLAVVGDVEPVQLVQPVGDGLAVPAEREVLRVVGDVVVLVLLLRLLLAQLVVGVVPLEVGARLLPLHVLLRGRPLLAQQVGELEDLGRNSIHMKMSRKPSRKSLRNRNLKMRHVVYQLLIH